MVELYEALKACTTSEIDGLSGEARATVELDDVHVLRVLVREAEAGHPEALLTLGRLHFIDDPMRLPNVEKNDVIAAEYFRKAAEQESVEAQDTLAWMYFHGDGVERNFLLAEHWNEKTIANDPDEERQTARTLQATLLSWRLSRVESAPLPDQVLSFTYKPLPTDASIRGLDETVCRMIVDCEVCATPVPMDGRKKYCPRCMVTAYCSKACQKADWKRHKKLCGKESEKKPVIKKKVANAKADIDVLSGYNNSLPGLSRFATALYLIHWNESPAIHVATRAGTDGMDPNVLVIPKSRWDSVLKSSFGKFYKDGPTRDKFVVTHDLQHLGPEVAGRGRLVSEIHLKPEFDRDPHAMFAVHQVRKRDLAEHLRRRTAHPATAEEMKAFYDRAYDVAKKRKKVFEPEPPASTSGGAENAGRGSTSE
jgi:hypothetical protein